MEDSRNEQSGLGLSPAGAGEGLAETSDSHEERLVEGRRLTERVDELIQQGKPLQAKSVLARSWQETVPDLPLRYPVVLEGVNARFARQLARFIRAGGATPSLDVELSGTRVVRGAVKIGPKRLGDLPAAQAQYLQEIGASAELYRARLTAIRMSSSGEVESVEIELARPELRRCPECGRLYPGDEPLCAECAEAASARKAKAAARSAESEAPPVALQEAIDAVVADQARPPEDSREPAAVEKTDERPAG